MSSGQKKYAVGVRFWLKDEQGHFMGAGRVQLLEYIKKFGSITNAAKEMKMSYRQAWQMVEDMNASAPEPLVEKILGGKGGGGARVTAMGEKVIALFHQLDEKMSTFAEELGREIVF